jgi:hypothetical protein
VHTKPLRRRRTPHMGAPPAEPLSALRGASVARQGRDPAEYVGTLCWLYVRSMVQMLVVQEPIKVLAITILSPQALPRVEVLRVMTCREGARLCLRGLLSALYSFILFL